MSQEMTYEERIKAQRLANLKIALLLPALFILETNRDLDEYTKFAVDKLVEGWEGVENTEQFVNAMCLNWESMGSQILSKELSEDKSSAIISDFTSKDLLDFLGMERSQYVKLFDFAIIMADKLDFNAQIEDMGDSVKLTVMK